MNAKRKRFFEANGNELCADGAGAEDTFSYQIFSEEVAAKKGRKKKGLNF